MKVKYMINYIFKKESDIDKFTAEGTRIELKEYQNNLVFYTPLNSLKAEYALYDLTASYDEKPEIYTGGPFGSYVKIKDYLKFNGNNVQTLGEEGRISVWVGTNKMNGSSSASLLSKIPETGMPAGEYSLTVNVQDYPSATLTIDLSEGATLKDIKNKLVFNLDPRIYKFELDLNSKDETRLILSSTAYGKKISITDGLQGNNLLDYFDIETPEFGSYPEEPITIFELGNFKLEHFPKEIEGKKYSYLNVILSDGKNEQIIEFPWNTDPSELDNIEIDFDKQVIYIFINGELVKIELLNVVHAPSNDDLILRGNSDLYSFDELIINNRIIHRKSFELPTKQLTKYSTEKPFIDFHFSGKEYQKGMELKIEDQYNCHACICDDGRFYYYNASSWRHGDGDFSKSNDIATFQNQLKDFDFSGKDFFIRVFFESNGTEKAYLDGINFYVDENLLEDEEGNTPAILMGYKEWDPEDKEDLIGKTINILTDKGKTTINFSLSDYEEYIGEITEEVSPTGEELLLTLDEVIDYINSYYPDGINKIYKDSRGRIVLVSETKGEEAFISVSEGAVPLIFGGDAETSSRGSSPSSGAVDYSEFYHTVKTYTGDGLLAIEATDEQIQLFLKEALEYYRKFKGDNLSQYTCQLEGDWQNGFKMPSVIEKARDIVDIIFRPVFPMKFYGEELIDGQEDITTLTLANYLFSGSGGAHLNGGIAQDFYISLISLQDFKQTLGINPKWEILNNKIYIYPANVARYTKVSIVYKSPISVEDALNDPDIIKYVSGKILMLIGNIRGAYGASLTTGSIPVQLNADSLHDRGKQLVDEAMESWKNSQPPLGFFMG